MKFFIALLASVAFTLAQPVKQESIKPIAILRQSNDVHPEGSYSYSYETADGIVAEAQGDLVDIGSKGENVVVAQGKYAYTAPDGSSIEVAYTADQNGFHPQGSHIPVAPAIPEAIQRALDYIASHPPKPEEQQIQKS